MQTSVPDSAATFSHPKTLQPVFPNDQEYKNLVKKQVERPYRQVIKWKLRLELNIVAFYFPYFLNNFVLKFCVNFAGSW